MMNWLSHLLVSAYAIRLAFWRRVLISIANCLERGPMYSQSLRAIFRKYYGVEVGLYTHGGCFSIGRFSPGVRVGRYCSIAHDVMALTRDHPGSFKSTHALFFNAKLDFCDDDIVEQRELSIGNDVWMGAFSVILPSVRNIGDGAIIGAGAVLSRDVPPYAVVAGNPARVVRFRFAAETIEELLASHWWEQSIEELKPKLREFQQPYEPENSAAVPAGEGSRA